MYSPVKVSGATPMTVNSCPFNRTTRPTVEGAPANSRCQKSQERTTTASRPGASSSSGRKPRPTCGSTPSERKKLPETSMPPRTSGAASRSALKPTVAIGAFANTPS